MKGGKGKSGGRGGRGVGKGEGRSEEGRTEGRKDKWEGGGVRIRREVRRKG